MERPKKTKLLDEPLPLLEHLGELRKRIVYCFATVILCAIFVYPYIPGVLKEISQPVGKLVFLAPAEAFMSRLKLAVFLGAFISLPFIIYQIWKFIQKGLLGVEKRFILPLTSISILLFYAGIFFAYFLIIPVGVKFLLNYGTETLFPMISVSRYLSFLFFVVFSFGLIFQLPLMMGFLAKLGVLDSRAFRQKRRIAIVAIFIAAAMLTPGPDVFSQLLMAGPLLILYEAGIIVAGLTEKKVFRKEK